MRNLHVVMAVLGLAASFESASARTSEFSGAPGIVDGDTVQFGETRLQIAGIDAPQTDQLCLNKAGACWKCGIAAREQLRTQAAGKSWTCKVVRKNRYGRLLAKCSADGDDIAGEMVRNGWALASTTGSAAYLSDEKEARASDAGLWAGAFVAPLDWRKRNARAKILGNVAVRVQSSAELLASAFGAVPPSPRCAIKGNINWSGKCTFHRPGGRRYKRLKMQAKYGDRWFCTPIEAAASGCRETGP